MTTKTVLTDTTSKEDLVLTRVFDAPRERVFKAWIEPSAVAQWWGPRGFSTPVCELDARPGGKIRIDMRGPDGTIYPSTGEFHEIVEPERLVVKTAVLDKGGNPVLEVLQTVTFVEHQRGTKLTLQAHVLKSTAEAAPYLAGMREGWNQTLERLGEFLTHRR